jgi:DNA-binding PadR family transcriptional regulator
LSYNPLKKYHRPKREKAKQEDIGEGPIKECILGILSHWGQEGCSITEVLNSLGTLRSQRYDRVKGYLDDLHDLNLIDLKDLSHHRKNLQGYVLTEKGKRHLERYFDGEYKETRDVSQSLSKVTYSDMIRFWEKYQRQY